MDFIRKARTAFEIFSSETVNFRLKIAPRDPERDKNCNGRVRFGTVWWIN
jgi:hypothetical protein